MLVRRLNAQETLGAVDLILTDKTGTLTEDRLSVIRLVTPDGPIEGQDQVAFLDEALRAEDDAWRSVAGRRKGAFAQALTDALAALDRVAALDPVDLLDCEGPADGRPYSRTRLVGGGGEIELALGAPEAVLALAAVAETEEDAWQSATSREAAAGGELHLPGERYAVVNVRAAAARDTGPHFPLAWRRSVLQGRRQSSARGQFRAAARPPWSRARRWRCRS